jgi:thiosulfate dehydrogenase
MGNGQGQMGPDGAEYLYPPLWGVASYNDGAGLYRISNFARYVKYNMPQGVTHLNPILTDEEAWDVAAYVNSQKRPHIAVPKDWPDISKKPVDHPFGPYADSFTEQQHKYGPFKPMMDAQKNSSPTVMK